jgi:hypothetical protein
VDVLELRLDFLQDFEPARDLEALMAACPLPYIVTYRPTWEGCVVDAGAVALCVAHQTVLVLHPRLTCPLSLSVCHHPPLHTHAPGQRLTPTHNTAATTAAPSPSVWPRSSWLPSRARPTLTWSTRRQRSSLQVRLG